MIFRCRSKKELDFTRDGMNAERLARNMRASGIPGIKVPESLLAMEFVSGVRSGAVEEIVFVGFTGVLMPPAVAAIMEAGREEEFGTIGKM